jgi:hypothetical protein
VVLTLCLITLAGGLAAAVLALTAGAFYARRRWSREAK